MNSESANYSMVAEQKEEKLKPARATSPEDDTADEHVGEDEPCLVGSEYNQTSLGMWGQMYQRLLSFHEQNGHCRVPNRYNEDAQLGAWVSTQRRYYKLLKSGRRKKTALTPEREKLLTDIGFEWCVKKPQWETLFLALLEFVVQNGHAQVPTKWKENLQLSNWVSNQRREYQNLQQGRPSSLNPRRIKLLKSIGFVWQAQRGGTRRLHDGQLVPASEEAVAVTESYLHDCRARARELITRHTNSDNNESSAAVSLTTSMPEEDFEQNHFTNDAKMLPKAGHRAGGLVRHVSTTSENGMNSHHELDGVDHQQEQLTVDRLTTDSIQRQLLVQQYLSTLQGGSTDNFGTLLEHRHLFPPSPFAVPSNYNAQLNFLPGANPSFLDPYLTPDSEMMLLLRGGGSNNHNIYPNTLSQLRLNNRVSQAAVLQKSACDTIQYEMLSRMKR